VLPIFINDGQPVTESPVVAVRLTNEQAVPLGEAAWIGQAIEIRASNTPDFEEAPWQRWEPLIPWALSSEAPGEYAVYVEFRDGAGRTAIAEDTIRLVGPGESPPTPTPFLNLPERAASPVTGEPEPTSLAAIPETVAPRPAEDSGAATPTPPASPGVEITPLPSVPDPGDEDFTPYPTWTPLPPDIPAAADDRGASAPLVLLFLLQGVVLLIGFAAFLRRH
jgi:hypothetical protein